MTNDNYHGTGVLILHAITPVIKALFGGYNLGAFEPKSIDVPKSHSVYIAKLSHADGPFWGDVLRELLAIARKLPACTSGADADNSELLRRLAAHFASEDAEVPGEIVLHLLEESDPAEETNLPSLFMLASSLDDGHALEGIIFEGAWYGGDLDLGAYSGHGSYTTERVSVKAFSGGAMKLGVELDSAIAEERLEDAAKVLAEEVRGLLAMIKDIDVRELVEDELMSLLWTDAAVIDDESGFDDDFMERRLM